jgi:murein hydrolase activator
LREVRLREAALSLQFDAKSEEIAQLLAVLMKMEADPAPLLLLTRTGRLARHGQG